MNKRKAFKVPHAFVILLMTITVVSLLTYIIPSGEYVRTPNAEGIMIAEANSYHLIEDQTVSLMQFLTAIPRGFVEAGWIIAMTFFVGAAFEVVKKIGLIPAMIESMASRYATRGIWAIPVLMFVFALIDSIIGTPELVVVYIPIVLPLMIRLGFDSITACAVVLCGSAAGFSAALTNPFTIAIGQKLSGLPLYSGWRFRVVTFIVTFGIGAIYVMRYASKIQKDPSISATYEDDAAKRAMYLQGETSKNNKVVLDIRQKIAGVYSLGMMAMMLIGIIVLKWDLPEMSAMFLAVGVGAGLIVKMDVNELCETLIVGFQEMVIGAMVIGASRAISVVMTDSQIIDSVVHGLATVLTNLPGSVMILGILVAVSFLNFLIPSGSGKAVVLFPILAPLADLVGITRQTAVVAYQFGDGFTNYLWPTVGYFMAALAIGGVSWQKWAKFYLPLFGLWLCSSTAFLFIAQFIKLGPF